MTLKIKTAAMLLSLLCLSASANAAAVPAKDADTAPAALSAPISPAAPKTAASSAVQQLPQSVILSWHDIPGAVLYELQLTDADTGASVLKKFDIYAAGCEINSAQADFGKHLLWQVRGLNADKVPISDYSEPKALLADKAAFQRRQARDARGFSQRSYSTYTAAKDESVRPLQLTTDFAEMAYMPVYPVYSWVPAQNAASYVINVYKADTADESLQPLSSYKIKSGVIDYYDPKAYTQPGQYYFNVAAYDSGAHKIAQSADSYFAVTAPVPVAALGDSITHGGGAVDTPPSSTLYNWETYSSVPVLNIGYSGNLTGDMLRRFDSDVLPFSPKLLVIMGGVNDVRTGISAQTVIANLAAIRDKCRAHDIVPVFLTMTSVNPNKMKKVINLSIAPDWQQQRQLVNDWIKKQDYYVDINSDEMLDARGFLPDNMTTDGLHPDYEGKKHIGETAGDYIKLNFSHLLY